MLKSSKLKSLKVRYSSCSHPLRELRNTGQRCIASRSSGRHIHTETSRTTLINYVNVAYIHKATKSQLLRVSIKVGTGPEPGALHQALLDVLITVQPSHRGAVISAGISRAKFRYNEANIDPILIPLYTQLEDFPLLFTYPAIWKVRSGSSLVCHIHRG